MKRAASDLDSKNAGKKSSWKTATIVTWITVVGVVAGLTFYLGMLVNSNEAQQVRKLRQELDSISDREYQLQRKIDSLNRLEVAEEQEDTTTVTSPW